MIHLMQVAIIRRRRLPYPRRVDGSFLFVLRQIGRQTGSRRQTDSIGGVLPEFYQGLALLGAADTAGHAQKHH